MENINIIVGNNLQELRKKMQLTLQEVSELTGVSKSMLGEIERGTASPTITVLWKIAGGLKIPFTVLVNEKKPSITLVRSGDMEALLGEDDFRISTIFKYDPDKKFEIFLLQLEPGSYHSSQGHNKGLEEYILLFEGELVVKVGEETLELKAGDSLHFVGQEPHAYINRHDFTTAKAYSMIVYENEVS